MPDQQRMFSMTFSIITKSRKVVNKMDCLLESVKVLQIYHSQWLNFRSKIRVNRKTGCWNWTGSIRDDGYGRFSYDNDKFWTAHRFMMEMTGHNIDGWMVLHKCDNRKCVNPAHLYLGTHQDNMRDMVKSGNGKGERSGKTKLTQVDVDWIREYHREFSRARMAKVLGISKQSVSQIVNHKSW
jgi:hypothetical protein